MYYVRIQITLVMAPGIWGTVSLEGDVPKFLDWDDTTGDFKAEDDIDEFIEKVRQRLEAK